MIEKGDSLIETYGSNVFDDNAMRKYLPGDTYKQLRKTINDGRNLDPAIADAVANGMKRWALDKGATHFTHWFQPMTGYTAEKHEGFINPQQDGTIIMSFSGKELVRGEADASSFPSGGMRATFEARGYTAWDCTSPAFVKEGTLCIPTCFCSFNGDILDKKTPLLRSMEAISKQAVRILRCFGDTDTKRVVSMAGAEQEYFLINKSLYAGRHDLMLCGRTLFGAKPAKGQELYDHYYGSIKEKVGSFMRQVDEELWSLGVPAKTEHNEVAPAQHECAPVYCTCNVAVDQNQLMMETMKRVAGQHGLVCLLHEKPFAGVNGSGKHNNWSISTDTGKNLLEPGSMPNDNLQFLLVLSCIIKAVDCHADLLRMTAACVGNDQRLGADEAPPAIVSIFLGDQLEDVVEQIIENGTADGCINGAQINTGVSTLPRIMQDATDRNRTSPFAFTGNKFEFRMVGSSDCIATANTVLNTIMAEAFAEAADVLEQSTDRMGDVSRLIAENLRQHKRVIFNGNGYSDEWIAEAQKRGLPNLPSMVASIPSLTTKKAADLFTRFGVLTEPELESRSEILYETYAKVTSIEARTMIHMASKHYVPAVVRYSARLSDSICKVRSACPAAPVAAQEKLLLRVTTLLNEAFDALNALKECMEQSDRVEGMQETAIFCHDCVTPAMKALRDPIDQLELLVDKDIWPVPTYGDLMFEV